MVIIEWENNLAAKEKGTNLNSIRLNKEFNHLFGLIKNFPHIHYKH